MNRIIISFAFILSSSSAFAHGPHGDGACKADVEKFCKDVKPGGGAIIKCLKEHNSELSAGCKEKGQEFKEKMHEMHEACRADHDKFCKDVKPGGGRILECFKKNAASLSAECKAAIAKKQ